MPSRDRNNRHNGGSRLRAVQEGRETPGDDGVKPWVKRDLNDAPAGADDTVWHLALKFYQAALRDRITLVAGVPAIYMEFSRLIDQHGIRGKSYYQETYSCRNRGLPSGLAARCWYHYPPDDPARQRAGDITWSQVFEVIMAEFWSRIQNEHALDHFRQYFQEYGQATLNHWHSLRTIKAIDAQPKKPSSLSLRSGLAGTMAPASKEG